MALAPFVGVCDADECERDDPGMTVWMPVGPGTHYARCYSCSRIRRVIRTREATDHESHPILRDAAEAVSEGDGA